MGWWYPPVVAHDTRACYPRKPATISQPDASHKASLLPVRISFPYPRYQKNLFSLYARAIPVRSTTAEAHANATRANLAPKNGKAPECAVMRFLVQGMSVSSTE